MAAQRRKRGRGREKPGPSALEVGRQLCAGKGVGLQKWGGGWDGEQGLEENMLRFFNGI